MRYLISTFGQGDYDRILQAMKSLPYEKLVLIGHEDAVGCEDLRRISRLEEASGHEVETELLDGGEFMGVVDSIADLLSARMKRRGPGDTPAVVLNISGGTKLLGDAALLAAFRVGIETYHVDKKVTRLPVIKGATALDRFTPGQIRMIGAIGRSALTVEELMARMAPLSRQAAERVIRELKKQGMLESGVEGGKVKVRLSSAALEVHRVLSQRTGSSGH